MVLLKFVKQWVFDVRARIKKYLDANATIGLLSVHCSGFGEFGKLGFLDMMFCFKPTILIVLYNLPV